MSVSTYFARKQDNTYLLIVHQLMAKGLYIENISKFKSKEGRTKMRGFICMERARKLS